MRTVSLAQIADAIELDGYPIAKRYYFKSHDDEPDRILRTDDEWQALKPGDLLEACALGQCALNLGVGPNELVYVLSETSNLGILPIQITELNDTGKTTKQIARMIRTMYKKHLTITIELPEFDYGSVFSNYQGVKV